MSLAVVKEDIVKGRPMRTQVNNFLGVIKNVQDMRRLMRRSHLEFPVVARFNPDVLSDQRSIRRMDEIFALLSEAKQRNGAGEEGKKLFVYRA